MAFDNNTNNADTSSSSSSTLFPSKKSTYTPAAAATAPSLLFANVPEKKLYWDRSHYDSPATQIRALAQSKTLYVGNLAFSTRSHHLLALFSSIGRVVNIHMGLDRYKKTPCGFGFVEYERRAEALEAVSCLSGCRLDGRVIRVELDAGFKPGRQYGRGVSGGQVRDDRRTTIDPARSKGGGGGGAASRRPVKWEAPSSQQNKPSQEAGIKREREEEEEEGGDDDDDENMEPPAKNPRFREEGSDDEM